MDICICVGSACHLKGSYEVIKAVEGLVAENKLEDRVAVKGAFCLGQCTRAVSVSVDGTLYSVSRHNVDGFFRQAVLDRLKEEGEEAHGPAVD